MYSIHSADNANTPGSTIGHSKSNYEAKYYQKKQEAEEGIAEPRMISKVF